MVTKGKLGWGEEMKKDECLKGNEEKKSVFGFFLLMGIYYFGCVKNN